jgi:BlaI family transcriptional regulator, penicillinase repressor
MTEPRPPVSDAERDVLDVLWEHGPAGVREVSGRLSKRGQSWSRSTVITLLQRLEKKRYVASDKSGFAFTFRAVVTRDELADQRLRELADELYDGQAAPLLLAFATRQRFTPAELVELRRLIDDLDAGRKRKKS